MQEAVIVSAVRTAVGKAPKGTLSHMRPDDMGAVVIGEALRRAGGLDPALVDDVILGCAMPEAEQGLNVARIASLRAGVPVEASAVTVNRFCSSGLQAIAYGAERIMLGHAQAVVAGGTFDGNDWTPGGRGNFWSGYAGYDADGDGLGDLPYQEVSLFYDLLQRRPELRLFTLSPAQSALDLAARTFPVFQPAPTLTDTAPRVRPPEVCSCSPSSEDHIASPFLA